MRRIILILLLLIILLVAGCSTSECNHYSFICSKFCKDNDRNGVCDKDEMDVLITQNTQSEI